MSKKSYKPVQQAEEAVKSAETKPARATANHGHSQQVKNPFKIIAYTFMSTTLVLLIILTATLFSCSSGGASSSDSSIASVLGKSYVTLGRKEVAANPDDKSQEITFWTWQDRNNAWGYCTVMDVPNYPSILLIVDANFKIEKLQEMSEFPIAGADKRAEYRDILGRYEGRTLVDFTSLELNVAEGDTRIFREMLRDQVARSLMTMYVKINGDEQFNTLFPQGIKFAKVGTKLNAWSVSDADGKEISSNYYAGRKYAIFTTTSCGSCINTCIGLAQRLITEGSMSPDQISIVFTSAKDKVDYLKNQMKGEHLVYDENMRGFAKSLNLFEGPSVMLVNSEGIVIAKEPSQRLSDQVNVDKVLQIFFKEK